MSCGVTASGSGGPRVFHGVGPRVALLSGASRVSGFQISGLGMRVSGFRT